MRTEDTGQEKFKVSQGVSCFEVPLKVGGLTTIMAQKASLKEF